MSPLEPLVLGFSSGPVCVASCGAVVLPWLVGEQRAFRGTLGLLGVFLLGRLGGYLAFGVVAWALGLALLSSGQARTFVFAGAHIALATALVVHAIPLGRTCSGSCAQSNLQSRVLAAQAASGRPRSLASLKRRRTPLSLGLLTGLSPCAPFLAAGVRAGEAHSLPRALGFFGLFFVGTSVWFAPFSAVAPLRRFDALRQVARFTTFIVAAYYGYLGVLALILVLLHG
ncbi:MAG: sulfite exporter TauE/SafE family protein [Polyangiaceae bacterium]